MNTIAERIKFAMKAKNKKHARQASVLKGYASHHKGLLLNLTDYPIEITACSYVKKFYVVF